jgi:hypothetical protein
MFCVKYVTPGVVIWHHGVLKLSILTPAALLDCNTNWFVDVIVLVVSVEIVPKLVIFGCAAVVKVPATDVAVMVATFVIFCEFAFKSFDSWTTPVPFGARIRFPLVLVVEIVEI